MAYDGVSVGVLKRKVAENILIQDKNEEEEKGKGGRRRKSGRLDEENDKKKKTYYMHEFHIAYDGVSVVVLKRKVA
jgi:hypothetical protein